METKTLLTVKKPFSEELEVLTVDEKWRIIRSYRNKLLQETDWTQLPDVHNVDKEAYIIYRQKLRDIPQDYKKPEDVIFPIM